MRSKHLFSILCGIWLIDRICKQVAIWHFFRRPTPTVPDVWPTISVLQPITRGVHDLAYNLTGRLNQQYDTDVQHILICDQNDTDNLAICRQLQIAFPAIQLVIMNGAAIASKIEKLQAGLPYATGEVLMFVDDDVALRPGAFQHMATYLETPQTGAVFGLACYTNWQTRSAALMSAFVNANALLNYIPVTYLTHPYTITGHYFAFKHAVFEVIGGLSHMDGRLDDDHELARRVERYGLHNVQMPLVYDIDNHLTTWAAYAGQMKRWFVIPQQCMLDDMALRDKVTTSVLSVGMFIPPFLMLVSLFMPQRRLIVGLVALCELWQYRHNERRYLGRQTPWHALWAVPVSLFLSPLLILRALSGDDEIQWRGQRIRVRRGGGMEVQS